MTKIKAKHIWTNFSKSFHQPYCHSCTASGCDILSHLSALRFLNKINHSRKTHHSFRTEVQYISTVTFALANQRQSPLGFTWCTLAVRFIVFVAFCIHGLSKNLINSLVLIVPTYWMFRWHFTRNHNRKLMI